MTLPPVARIHTREERRRRLSLVWLIPLVTAVIGAWLAWTTLDARGPMITVTFQTAEGLIPGQSRVRHKDVDMGVVQKIVLRPDLKGVVVTIRMNKEAEPWLNENARFWVVKARFFAGAVSGLQTLLSGAYIEFRPSADPGIAQYSFKGLEDPPVLQADTPGREFRLKADRIGAISLGSPIFFRDFNVGEVLGWDVSEMAESVTIHAFVRAPFDKYVHDTSRFWSASGVSVDIGANGLQVQVESLRALVLGGIAFDTPTPPEDGSFSPSLREFRLFASKEAAESAQYTRSPPLLTVFSGSAAGLTKGAPVKVKGIKIGEVDAVSLEYDRASDSVVAVARFFVEPDRIAQMEMPSTANLKDRLEALVRRGLRVKLETASLITGTKQLSVDVFPMAEPATLGRRGDLFVLPAMDDGASDIVATAGVLMERISAFPFEEVGRNLNDTLSGASALVNDPALKKTVESMRQTLSSTQAFIQSLNKNVEPAVQRLPAIAQHLDETLRNADRLIGSLDSGYGANSQVNRDVNRLMLSLTEAARSIRVLADLLARHPEALIRGRTTQGP